MPPCSNALEGCWLPAREEGARRSPEPSISAEDKHGPSVIEFCNNKRISFIDNYTMRDQKLLAPNDPNFVKSGCADL
jgi:hypothetical protein